MGGLDTAIFRASPEQKWLALQVGPCNLLRPQCFLQTGGKGFEQKAVWRFLPKHVVSAGELCCRPL